MKKTLCIQKQKGQGLVEYALILVLVAVVVIAVLLIIGPTIGNVFTKVNTGVAGAAGVSTGSTPNPTPCTGAPSACGYTACAVDGGTCTLPNGSYSTAYGASQNGDYLYGSTSSSFFCGPSSFGGIDPDYGVVKTCYYK